LRRRRAPRKPVDLFEEATMAAQSGDGRKQVEKEIVEHFGFVPDFYQALPRSVVGPLWAVQRDLELADTAIPGKYKELIGLAVAAHIKCRYCVYFHTVAARAHGATDEELREALAFAGLTATYSDMLTGMQVDIDRFRAQTDKAIAFMTGEGKQPHAH
jgi:AhpD family alkylhydroperoxidase